MRASVTIDFAELAEHAVAASVSARDGRTLVWLGTQDSDVATWVCAKDARLIAAKWAATAELIAGVERERTMPTLTDPAEPCPRCGEPLIDHPDGYGLHLAPEPSYPDTDGSGYARPDIGPAVIKWARP